MTIAHAAEETPRKLLRLWPGVVIVILQWLVRFVVPVVAPEAGMFAVIGGVFGGGLAILVWWVFLSRRPGPIAWALSPGYRLSVAGATACPRTALMLSRASTPR